MLPEKEAKEDKTVYFTKFFSPFSYSFTCYNRALSFSSHSVKQIEASPRHHITIQPADSTVLTWLRGPFWQHFLKT
jgi:hypothetical protein